MSPMKISTTRRKVYFVRSIGFRRRLPRSRPFVVGVYRLCEAAA